MYYDVEIRLTQGWTAIARDLQSVPYMERECAYWFGKGFEVRYVLHWATV